MQQTRDERVTSVRRREQESGEGMSRERVKKEKTDIERRQRGCEREKLAWQKRERESEDLKQRGRQ